MEARRDAETLNARYRSDASDGTNKARAGGCLMSHRRAPGPATPRAWATTGGPGRHRGKLGAALRRSS